MDNKNVEVLDDFGFEEVPSTNTQNNQGTVNFNQNVSVQNNQVGVYNTPSYQQAPVSNASVNELSNNQDVFANQQSSILNNQNNMPEATQNPSVQNLDEIENPVVEIINTKKTMILIVVILVILFLAVFFMPKIFELIGTI